MLPNRASDAGEFCRRPHPMDPTEYVTCAACLQRTPKTSASRCQGAVPDLCCSYVCDEHRSKCWGCNLPVCPEHAITIDRHIQCAQCAAEITNYAVLALAEALEVDPEVLTPEKLAAIRGMVA